MTKPQLITKAFFLFFFCTCSFHVSSAQTPFWLNGDRIISSNDKLVKEQWAAFKKNKNISRRQEDIYTLPVVFHIIHQNGPENVADAAVLDALQRLNDAFANRGIYDQGSGVDAKIQFCLAKKDPDGNYTNGINRVYADLVTINDVRHPLLESLVKWDPGRYINIYLAAEVDIINDFYRCGYADQGANGYGGGGVVVMQAGAMQSIIVHEMGHALDLDHTFSGWCENNDCLLDGDGVCDTPPEETIYIKGGCTDPENSCYTDTQSGFTTDQNDLKTNHMDYGNQSCQHDFTAGQKERMRFYIETFHPGWITADVCTNDCASPAGSEFTFLTLPEYSIGRRIDLTNTSTGATGYEWSVNNSFASSSFNYSYVFPGQGWYKFNLLAKPTPDEVKCRNDQLNWIRVYCSTKAIIIRNKKKARVGEPIHFSCHITEVIPMPDPIQYEWYYDNGILFGTSASFDHAFTTAGIKTIYLVTIRGACRDTSLPDLVDIKELPDYTLNLNGLVCAANKSNTISFSVCSKGHFDTPAGLPITFYSSNPTTGPASVIGTYYTNDVITQYCCKDFEFELPASYTGSFIFGVVNDDHSHSTPFNLATDFPVTTFHETVYTNNLDELLSGKFSVAIAPGDVSVLIGSSVALTAVPGEPTSSITWLADQGSFSCNTCINTSFTPIRYTRVIVKAISKGGCLATDTIIVKVLANGEVFIPSAFTPNDDKLNDYFYVLGGESITKISSFMVFNRWGERVCSRQNVLPNIPHAGWDGRLKGYPAIPDVYAYLITVQFKNGITKKYKGTITFIR